MSSPSELSSPLSELSTRSDGGLQSVEPRRAGPADHAQHVEVAAQLFKLSDEPRPLARVGNQPGNGVRSSLRRRRVLPQVRECSPHLAIDPRGRIRGAIGRELIEERPGSFGDFEQVRHLEANPGGRRHLAFNVIEQRRQATQARRLQSDPEGSPQPAAILN